MKIKLFFLTLLFATSSLANNLPYEQAKKAGIKKCLSEIKGITDFIIANKPHGSHSTWSSKNTDESIYSSTIEINHTNDLNVTSIFITPTINNKCSIAYERVAYLGKSCIALSKEDFSKFDYKGELNKTVSILSRESGGHLYLMPAGEGCIAIRKEIIQD